MAIGRPITPINLSAEERTSLKNWARRPKSAQALAQRAKAILLCAEGGSNDWMDCSMNRAQAHRDG